MKKKMSRKKIKGGTRGQYFNHPFGSFYGQQSSSRICSVIKEILQSQKVNQEDYKLLFNKTKLNEFLTKVNNDEDLFQNLISILNLQDADLMENLR